MFLFKKDNTIKTIKTVKLTEFILLQAKSSSEIKIILFSRFGGMQIVVRKGMQYVVKIKTFSSFTLFFSVHSSHIENYKNFKLVSLQHRRKKEIYIDISVFKSPEEFVA